MHGTRDWCSMSLTGHSFVREKLCQLLFLGYKTQRGGGWVEELHCDRPKRIVSQVIQQSTFYVRGRWTVHIQLARNILHLVPGQNMIVLRSTPWNVSATPLCCRAGLGSGPRVIPSGSPVPGSGSVSPVARLRISRLRIGRTTCHLNAQALLLYHLICAIFLARAVSYSRPVSGNPSFFVSVSSTGSVLVLKCQVCPGS